MYYYIASEFHTCVINFSSGVIGHTGMSATQLAENVMATISTLCSDKGIPGGSANVKNIYIKTEDSMSLPLFVSHGTF